MNKIIRDVPVEHLPKEWQEGLPPDAVVEIELRTVPNAAERVRLTDLVGSVPNIHGSPEEVIRYIRELREGR